jgi:hypothetical protein
VTVYIGHLIGGPKAGSVISIGVMADGAPPRSLEMATFDGEPPVPGSDAWFDRVVVRSVYLLEPVYAYQDPRNDETHLIYFYQQWRRVVLGR